MNRGGASEAIHYRDLFPSAETLVRALAFAFACVHLVFRNKLALVMTALGGSLLAMRFLQTRPSSSPPSNPRGFAPSFPASDNQSGYLTARRSRG